MRTSKHDPARDNLAGRSQFSKASRFHWEDSSQDAVHAPIDQVLPYPSTDRKPCSCQIVGASPPSYHNHLLQHHKPTKLLIRKRSHQANWIYTMAKFRSDPKSHMGIVGLKP